jgi:hypothetical protein
MKKLISCCGLDCGTCDARTATINNDDELRKSTAEKWSVMYSAAILPSMINCSGCREEGVKFSHCSVCEIRNCAKAKGFSTCGECSEMLTCEIVAGVHRFVPDAIVNLKSLN